MPNNTVNALILNEGELASLLNNRGEFSFENVLKAETFSELEEEAFNCQGVPEKLVASLFGFSWAHESLEQKLKLANERKNTLRSISDKDFNIFLTKICLMRRFGSSWWYPYNLKRYGVKWDTYSISYNFDGDNTQLFFETAWDLPLPVMIAISERFSNRVIPYFVSYEGSDIPELNMLHGGELLKLNKEFIPRKKNSAFLTRFEFNLLLRYNREIKFYECEKTKTDEKLIEKIRDKWDIFLSPTMKKRIF